MTSLRKLKVLWVSDKPTDISAYGQQTALIVPALVNMGYEIVLYTPRLTGRPVKFKETLQLTGRDAMYNTQSFGDDMIAEHCRQHGCNVVITFKDPYAFYPPNMRNLGALWMPLVPVDSSPISERNKIALQYATRPIAVTKHGQKELREIGLDAQVIPHAIDPAVFKPTTDRAAVRKTRGIDPDIFVVTFVGDNATDPSRKNIEGLLMAWSLFHEKHPDAELVLHTDVTPDRGGIDIMQIIDGLEIPRHAIRVTSPYTYATGASPEQVAALYQCANVVINIGNEGFGMPTIEAQACGVPVIGIDWAATPELLQSGYLIDRKHGDPYPSGFGSMYFRPFVRAIFQSLETAFETANTYSPSAVSAQMTPYHLANIMPLWRKELDAIQNLLESKIDKDAKPERVPEVDKRDSGVQQPNRRTRRHARKA